jgi:hypothetical protein
MQITIQVYHVYFLSRLCITYSKKTLYFVCVKLLNVRLLLQYGDVDHIK